MNLKDKKALVTGSSRGIGLAIAELLAREGVSVFLTARDEAALRKAAERLSDNGSRVYCASCDLSDAAQIETMFGLALKTLGGIDILINNAGFNIKKQAVELEIGEWDRIFAVNIRAAFALSRLAAREMKKQGSGFIINIGSGASQTPIAEYAAYCATKYGLLGFSESLALELRSYGIKVSIILPGSTATHFGGSSPDDKLSSMPGMLRADDIAECALFLLKQAPQAWTSVMNLRPLNPRRS
jgi:short-subunit dehydrogenase